jgi:transcriptional regulator with XRE-family HTH domain
LTIVPVAETFRAVQRRVLHPLTRFRARFGLSLKKVAELTESSPAAISRIETRKQDPSLRFIRRVRMIPGCRLTADQFMRAGVPLEASR